MNLILANSFTTFFNNLFSNWQLVLFIVLTILLLLTIFFKRFKTTFFILLATAIAIGGVLLTLFIIEAVHSDLYGLIDLAIAWVPTVLFSLIVVISTLINAKRGRRKSLVLLAQSTAAAIVWVLFYYFAVKSTKIDEALVKFVNLFMGEDGIQSALNVSKQATTFRSILTLYLESLGGKGIYGTLLSDASSYVYTIADMAYHIAFAVLCYVFYLLTVFILYLIYLCFYSERKYKRKKMKAFSENKSTVYKKHHVAGGFVGLARGLLTGVMCLSFIGACLYMVVGKGEGKIRDYEVSGKYEKELKIYRSLESYGTQGIFMILNAMSDPADMPYYLFAADLVFSGELNDEHNEVSADVNLRGDLGEFTGLVRDTITLLVKHGEGKIGSAIDGTSDTGLMSSVLSVMRDKEFQREFDMVIAEYDSPTYTHNLVMSLVSSLLANLDSTSIGGSLSPMNKELLKIMFKQGYLSEYIPEDCVLHDINVTTKSDDPWSTTGRNVRPYLGLQQLVSKEDVRRFVKIFFTILSEKGEGAGTFDMIRSVIPEVKGLTLFENGKNKSVDPVLARIYCYFQNYYLKADGTESYSYNALLGENVAWVNEIDSLLNVAEDFYTVYDDVKDAESAVFNRILYIFDADNPNRERDIALYDKIEENVSASRILGKTFGTRFFQKTLSEGLGQLFDNFYIPKGIVYENTFTENGAIKSYGELHYFLKGLGHLGKMEDQSFFELLFGDEKKGIGDILDIVADAVNAVNENGEDQKNLAYYIARSDLLRSLVSCFLIERGSEAIYVPNTVHEKNENGDYVNLIAGDELETLLNGMKFIVPFVRACIEDGKYYENIDNYLDDSDFMDLIKNSRIAEGSLAMLVKDKLCDKDGEFGSGDDEDSENDGEEVQTLIVPRYYADDVDNWCSPNSSMKGELRRFISSYLALREAGGEDENGYKLSLQNLMNGEQEELLSAVSKLGTDQSEEERKSTIDTFLSSDIIHYTVSDYLQSSYKLNELTVVVPRSARNDLYNDVLDSVIKRSELYLVFSRVNELGIEDTTTTTELLKKLITNQDLIQGDVLSASVVVNVANNKDFLSALRLDDVTVSDNSNITYFFVGQRYYLENGYYSENPWSEELPKLLAALEALFPDEVLNDASFEFSVTSMKDAILNADDDAFNKCRDSRILRKAYLAPTGDSEEESEEENA